MVSQIEEAIFKKELCPGDTLPSERELKEMFQTSRGTLREALRVLEQKGLIEIRLGAGGGAVVKDAPTGSFSDSLALLIRLQKISLTHLSEFREGIEGTVAALAAERAEPGDIDTLEKLLLEAKQYAEQGHRYWDDFYEIDKQMHQILAEITDNPLYILISEIVHENIHQYYNQYLSIDDRRMMENYQDLCNIVNAVKAGQADAAQTHAQYHVRRFSQYMSAALQDGTAEQEGADPVSDS